MPRNIFRMLLIITCLVPGALGPSPLGLGPVGVGEAAASTVREQLRMPSRLLDRDLVFSLYLPSGHPGAILASPGGEATADRSWPLLILLHGHGGNDRDWLRAGKLRETADQLVASGVIRPLIVVMPDADNSWYVDNPDPGGGGPVASALLQELPAHLARHYGASLDPEESAVAGLSMGGYGALRFAFGEPERFAAVASLSGAVFSPETSRAAFSALQLRLFNIAFGDPLDPIRFDEASPFSLVTHLEAANPRPDILLMAGDDDFFLLDHETMRLHLALEAAGIESEIRITDGGHVWPLWADHLEAALRFIEAAWAKRSPNAE